MTVCLVAAAFVVGAVLTYVINKTLLASRAKTIIEEAEKEAEVLTKNKLLEVKEEFLQRKAELEKQVNSRNSKLQSAEAKLKQRELQLNQQQGDLQRRKNEADAARANYEKQLEAVEKREQELEKLHKAEIEHLEKISGISAEEAKERLVNSLVDEAKTQAASYINDIMDDGRNIRALEAATGVEIIVDDTPEAIVLSAFDPVRREIARLALHQLVIDGRIHPARIEEVVSKVRKQIEEEIIETGKRTAIDLGIHGLHPELIRLVGKMKYRSSYGQNLLQHSRETANLCAVMASELGLNPKKARRAGLLHDIGKVPDEEPELPHALLGMKLAEKYKEKPDICNAIGAHHDEVEMNSLLAPIVQVCDAISGARPGARREVVEAYIKRLNDLEQLALSYPGVTKTYAIQAGRELRVIVGADKIDDVETERLSGEIAKRIQDEMTYPGQVKITVIRETRAVSFAK